MKSLARSLGMVLLLGACAENADFRKIKEFCERINSQMDFTAVEIQARTQDYLLTDSTVLSSNPYRVQTLLQPRESYQRGGCFITHNYRKIYSAEFEEPTLLPGGP